LGHIVRTRRLVRLAAALAWRTAGRITQVVDDPAEREAAYRLIENSSVVPEAISAAASDATARRAAQHDMVFVPVDGSSLNIKDATGDKGLGVIGARGIGATGLQVMSAIAVAPDGTPLGLSGQAMWTRLEPSTVKHPKRDLRPLHEKETRYWHEVIEQAQRSFDEHGGQVRPWYQLDRGGDAASVLLEAVGISDRAWVTVRVAYNRRVVDGDSNSYLLDQLEQEPPAAFYNLEVAPTAQRKARVANMQLRFTQVALNLSVPKVANKVVVPMWLVAATEIDTTPAGEDPIEWRLLTTYSVENIEAAMLVVHGYSTRWRIERFHYVWKTGACRIEDTRLRDVEHIQRWARISASVAMRILRLTYLARTAPQTPATAVLKPVEVQAIIMLRRPKGISRKQVPGIGPVVQWLAELGGYAGKYSGPPPGAQVIARGLTRIESLVDVLTGPADS
jgi:hypothetical protein